ncbi:FA53A protein, partial [Polyodon spathula]|nr:FA53A protein [Polyodon spathula]
AFSENVLKIFSMDCKKMSEEIFEQTMPVGKHWRVNCKTVLPSSPSEYAASAAQSVIGLVLEGIQPLPDDGRIPALTEAMTAFMEAWMDHILKQKIKFSIQGALQLKQDFDMVRDLIKSEKYSLSEEIRQRLLSMRVFHQVDNAIICLLQQPTSKAYIPSRTWEPFRRCCSNNSRTRDFGSGNLNSLESLDLQAARNNAIVQAENSMATDLLGKIMTSGNPESYLAVKQQDATEGLTQKLQMHPEVFLLPATAGNPLPALLFPSAFAGQLELSAVFLPYASSATFLGEIVRVFSTCPEAAVRAFFGRRFQELAAFGSIGPIVLLLHPLQLLYQVLLPGCVFVGLHLSLHPSMGIPLGGSCWSEVFRASSSRQQHSPEKLIQSGSLFSYKIHEESPWRVISRGCSIRTETSTTTKNAPFRFPVCPFSHGATDSMALQWQREAIAVAARTRSSGTCGGESSSMSVLPGWISELNLENCMPPLAPPTKRHCRSLSEPDELARCRSPWKPSSSSKVWTPISKQRCNSGGNATLQRCNSHGSTTMQRSTSVSLPQPSYSSSSSSSSCSSKHMLLNSSAFSVTSRGPYDHHPRRRLSLSQEHITDTGNLLPSANSTPTSTPELSRRQGLLRCRSQPCVLNERKSGLKRRREEDVRWSRPSLDFLKMTRTLKNSKSLCSLDYEEDDEHDNVDDDPHMKTIVSSPCDSNDLLMNIITPGSSPEKENSVRHHHRVGGRHLWSFGSTAAVSESDEDTSDCESTEFPLDLVDLDLEQIENN